MTIDTAPLVRAHTARGARPPRIALYSHDTCGLGHVRRNLLIAQTLAQALPGADLLLISGAREAGLFPVPAGLDVLTLPGLFKQADGSYRPRRFSFGIDELIALRSRMIRTALEGFVPDLLLVDNVPRGALGELDEPLAFLRRHTGTRCVLGLRDVLDDPKVVRQEWKRAGAFEAVRDGYDAVWVYGDPNVYDAAAAYGFPPEMRAKLVYTGYLDPRKRLTQAVEAGLPVPAPPEGPFYLCTVGGGQDGHNLATAFAAASWSGSTPGLIVTGPFMSGDACIRLRAFCDRKPDLHLERFVSEQTVLFPRAARVVSMGGYNTVCELLALGKRALVVPRVQPRREQWIRANRLQQRGLLDVLHPAAATPGALGRWLSRPLPPLLDALDRIDMNGLTRLVTLVRQQLSPMEQGLTQTRRRDYAAG